MRLLPKNQPWKRTKAWTGGMLILAFWSISWISSWRILRPLSRHACGLCGLRELPEVRVSRGYAFSSRGNDYETVGKQSQSYSWSLGLPRALGLWSGIAIPYNHVGILLKIPDQIKGTRPKDSCNKLLASMAGEPRARQVKNSRHSMNLRDAACVLSGCFRFSASFICTCQRGYFLLR